VSSAVNTIVLAYAGASRPLLLLIAASNGPIGKAADRRRLHGLTPDENTAPIVRRIYTKFLAGNGL
jgi:hypothetical protein